MRVLHVIQELGMGGAERVVVALARGAQDAGHEVAVAAAGGALAAELGGAARYGLPLVERRPHRVPGGALAVHRALRHWRPDLVHCHNPGTAVLTGLATVRGRRARGLVSVHGVPDEDYGSAARALRLAGLPIVACGPGVAAGLEEQRLWPAATIVNGVAPAPPSADRAALDREWSVPPGRPLAICVGRLAPVKNHALALRALAGLPTVRLALIGEGTLRAELERESSAMGVADRVIFGGLRADARAIMGAADAVVLPSRSEGLPLVALEALAAGTPLVATAVRGIRELVKDGETALLVAPDDPPALAAALGRVLGDETLARDLAARGLQLAARHTEDAMVESYLTLYRSLRR
ncbi:MAG: glycosyltransferase [Gaiellaceae bacterium]